MSDEEIRTSASLLERLKGQDEQAWERFVHVYTPLVFRWCRKMGLGEHAAHDMGQEVFLAVSQAIGEFRHGGPGDTFRGWLRVITKRKVYDWHRRNAVAGQGEGGSEAAARFRELPEDLSGASSSQDEEKEELRIVHRRAVDSILATVEPQNREAFLRVVLGRESPAEVARALGIKVNAVYLAKSRLLKRIRDEFAGLLD